MQSFSWGADVETNITIASLHNKIIRASTGKEEIISITIQVSFTAEMLRLSRYLQNQMLLPNFLSYQAYQHCYNRLKKYFE